MKNWMTLVLASTVLVLSACGGGESTSPKPSVEPEPIRIEKRELQYGEHSYQRAVLYEPVNVQNPRQLIVWVHGGGWFAGKPDGDAPVFLDAYLKKGHPVFSIGYRLNEDGVFPNAEQDVLKVLHALEGDACEKCETSEHWRKIQHWASQGYVLAGGSAGGSLALLGAGQLLTERQGQSAMRCAASFVGVLDVREIELYHPYAQSFIGDHLGKSLAPEKLAQLSVPHYVENNLWSHLEKVRWAFGATRNDILVPWATVKPVIELWKARGLDTIAEVIDGTPDGGHALSTDEISHLLGALLEGCLQ